MNITFHSFAAFATGTALAARMPERSGANPASRSERSPGLLRDLPWLAAGLVGNVLLHGAMDLSPHSYPIPWRLDILGGIMLIAVVMARVQPRYRLVFAAVFLGELLPDLVDQGPGLLNQLLGLHLPEREYFGFHSLRHAVAAALGHEVLLSVLSHLVVLAGCALLLVGARRRIPSLFRRR